MEEMENSLSRIKKLSKILERCADARQENRCENCFYKDCGRVTLICKSMIDDLLKEIEKL